MTISGEELENITCEAIGVDISSSGLGVVTDYALKEGDVLKSRIPVIEMDTALPVYAEVVWSKPHNGKFRVGLRFLV
jgi:hypothetical protein